MTLTSLLFLAGCGSLDFDVEQRIPEQIIQGNPLGGLLPLGLFEVPLTMDIEQSTKARGTGPASAAHLRSLTLSITGPAGQTFDFIDSITIEISADGLPTREVARLPARQNAPTLTLQSVRGVDILPYINKGARMSARGTGRMPRQDTTFDGRVVVTVEI